MTISQSNNLELLKEQLSKETNSDLILFYINAIHKIEPFTTRVIDYLDRETYVLSNNIFYRLVKNPGLYNQLINYQRHFFDIKDFTTNNILNAIKQYNNE